jgi:hypothetical protein
MAADSYPRRSEKALVTLPHYAPLLAFRYRNCIRSRFSSDLASSKKEDCLAPRYVYARDDRTTDSRAEFTKDLVIRG